MSIQKVEMTVERIENGQYVEQVAYPYVEYEHVTMENGMDIMSMIRDDVSTPMVTHNATSWKVGQGDSDVSESIVDSSVASMTIKGQTYQNILPSPSLRNSMTNGKTMQKLNEGYDSVSTVDGVCKSAILTGQTLVNRFDFEPIFEQRSGGNWDIENKGNGVYTITAKKNKVGLRGWFINHPEVNQTHTMIFEVFENTSTTGYARLWAKTQMTNVACNIDGGGFGAGEIGVYKLVGRGKNADGYAIVFEGDWNTGESITFRLTWLDGDHYYLDSGFNTGSVKMPVLTTTGKNLFDENRRYESSHKLWFAIPFEKDSYFTFSSFDTIPYIEVYGTTTEFIDKLYGGDGVSWKPLATFSNKESGTFKKESKYNYIIIAFDKAKLSNGEDFLKNLQVEQGTQATSYEPFKTNILSTSEEVVLRGIGDVRDELDLVTGEYTKAIYEYTFTGDEDWRIQGAGHYTYFTFSSGQLPIKYDYKNDANVPINCNRLPIVNYGDFDNGLKNVGINLTYSFRLNFSDCDSNNGATVEDLKAYLKANPTTVQYPISKSVKTVDLSILDQDNQPVTQLNSFANGCIQVSSQEGSLIPTTDYEVPTSNSYHVDLMKPNTQYTMKNMQSTFIIDGIQYSASVNGTFTSPSTLSNRLMITNVVQTQPMLLEGDMTSKEVPYVEGNKSAFEGVDKVEVLSTGKNLFNAYKYKFDTSSSPGLRVEVLSSNSIRTYCTDIIAWRSASVIYRLKPHTWYNIRCEASGNGVKQIDINIPEYGTSWNPNTVNCAQSNNMLGKFLTDESGKVKLTFQGSGSESISYDNTYTNIQIEEIQEKNVVHTYYEPYKSNISSFQLPHPLHSLPNGVRDEIVLDRVNHKAKIIQRVGEDLTQLETPIVTEVNLEGYPYVYKGGHIFLNTEIAPTTEVTYSINQAHQIESSNEDILRHQKEINHLYELIAQYVQVQYEAELIDIALQG